MRKITCLLLFAVLILSCACSCKKNQEPGNTELTSTVTISGDRVIVEPYLYYSALRNPMKGLREFFGPGYDEKRAEYPFPYGSIIKEYMQWNMLENNASDGVDKIIAYSNHRWEGVEDINVKIIPRVYIVWIEPWHGGVAKNTYTDNPDDLRGWHWPEDIPGEVRIDDDVSPITGGYFDPSFQDRVKALVEKLGQAWDNDPRVAYVEMGIIGEWGEHHDPDITEIWPPHEEPEHVANRTWVPGIEKVLGDAFTAAFKNKKVMVRYAYEFNNYEFGIYWDSWAQPQEIERGYQAMLNLGDRWKSQPMGGEITWGWGDLARNFDSFEEVVGDPVFKPYVIEQIRNLHCNHLGGITWADFSDPAFMANAKALQKAMGYRYELQEFSYPTRINKGDNFDISFKLTNTGSSPFYYNWPVEIALLDEDTKEAVWSGILEDTDISQWMPGENWDKEKEEYLIKPPEYTVEKTLTLDADIPEGKYIISISILDPSGMMPSIRFATANYFTGGRHPMGYVGINTDISEYEVNPAKFNEPSTDKTLKYIIE